MKLFVRRLWQEKACEPGIRFAEGFDSMAEAWKACEQGDWMAWWAARCVGKGNIRLTLAACDCARLALPYTLPAHQEAANRLLVLAEAEIDPIVLALRINEVREVARNHAGLHYGLLAVIYAANTALRASNAVDAISYAWKATNDDDFLKKCSAIFRNRFPEVPVIAG